LKIRTICLLLSEMSKQYWWAFSHFIFIGIFIIDFKKN
jgi:hypothetical protein